MFNQEFNDQKSRMIKSKLKRRLRKKYHLGEFQEFGFEVLVNFKDGTDDATFDKFCSRFIREIEKNELFCGGGGDYNRWKVFVTAKKQSASQANINKEKIKIWLENYFDVKNFKIGETKDAWY